MKYIYNYIEHSLNESFNSKEAKKKFLDTGLISKKDFTIIKKAFLPKYVYWGCRERVNPENKDVILDSIYDIILWFEGNKQYLKSKDLYSYTYDEIRLLMNDPSIGPKKKKTKGQGDYEIIYEDDQDNIIVHIKDHTASVYWAHKYRQGEIPDGQWCTAAYNTDQMFKDYSKTGPIFIYILPNEVNLEHQRLCTVTTAPFNYYITDKKGNYYITNPVKYKLSFFTSSDMNFIRETSNVAFLKTRIVDDLMKKHLNIRKKANMKFSIGDIKDISLLDLTRFNLHYDIIKDRSVGPLQKEIFKYTNTIIKTFDRDKIYKFNNYKKAKDNFNDYINKGYKYAYVNEPINDRDAYHWIIFSRIKYYTNYKYNIVINQEEHDMYSYDPEFTKLIPADLDSVLNYYFKDDSEIAHLLENTYFDSYVSKKDSITLKKDDVLFSLLNFLENINIENTINYIIDSKLFDIIKYFTNRNDDDFVYNQRVLFDENDIINKKPAKRIFIAHLQNANLQATLSINGDTLTVHAYKSYVTDENLVFTESADVKKYQELYSLYENFYSNYKK